MPTPNTPTQPQRDRLGPAAHRQILFEHGAHRFSLIVPRCADELIDEEAFNRDERLPYWADLWPAARALARWLLDHRETSAVPMSRIIELGCGFGLPSIVLKSQGFDVLATDYEPEALDAARRNAANNHALDLATALLDWRDPPADLGRFDLAIGADLMYEQRNALAVAALLPRILVPGGRFILADPGRRYLPQFEMLMKQAGWSSHELGTIVEEPTTSSCGAETATATSVRIIAFDQPRTTSPC